MKTGLFIGRFQPFHNAHLQDIKDALKEVDVLYIGIGSSEESFTKKNPFTFHERAKMIRSALHAEKIRKFRLFSIPDKGDDQKWVSFIEKKIKVGAKSTLIFTGNPWTRRCFLKRGYEVRKVKMLKGISATKVRKGMEDGGEWMSLVPKMVASHIKKSGEKNRRRILR